MKYSSDYTHKLISDPAFAFPLITFLAYWPAPLTVSSGLISATGQKSEPLMIVRMKVIAAMKM